ncbi:MAG: radical SAM protein [Promethearchaeota archaeon]|nr:MAG: radical SAM protein [Candidatus Lokiarchaeota archaeon]
MWNKVLLIYPNIRSKLVTDNFKIPPLGLEYLMGHIKDLVEVDILDARNLKLDLEDIREYVAEYKPDLCGISVNLTCGINLALDMAEIVKEQAGSECDVILGGWHPTLAFEEILENPHVDAVIRGEGELTFTELIKKGTFKDILGISYKKDGKPIHNEDRPLIENLDKLKFPYREYRKVKRYSMLMIPMDVVETSRGCPFSCNFCCIHEFYRHKYRMRSAKSIVKELYEIKKMSRVDDILIVDDNFTVNVNHVKELCELIIKSNLNLHFIAQVRVDSIVKHPEMVELMAKAGFWLFFIGIESITDKGLKDINKRISVTQILKAIDIVHKNNIIIIGNIILGSDLDASEQDVLDSIRRARNFQVDFLTYSILTPLPRTKFYKQCEEEGLIVNKNWGKYSELEAVIRTYKLSSEQLDKLHRIAMNQAFLHRNYKAVAKRILKSRGLIFLLLIIWRILSFSFQFMPSMFGRAIKSDIKKELDQ